MATTTRTTPAQRETLLNLIRASEAAKAAAKAAAAAKKELETAESAAVAIIDHAPRTIRDDSGTLRTISVSLDKSFTASGTPEERVQFAKEHGLKISAPDCTTSSLKTVAPEAMAAGLLIPVAKIVID